MGVSRHYILVLEFAYQYMIVSSGTRFPIPQDLNIGFSVTLLHFGTRFTSIGSHRPIFGTQFSIPSEHVCWILGPSEYVCWILGPSIVFQYSACQYRYTAFQFRYSILDSSNPRACLSLFCIVYWYPPSSTGTKYKICSFGRFDIFSLFSHQVCAGNPRTLLKPCCNYLNSLPGSFPSELHNL